MVIAVVDPRSRLEPGIYVSRSTAAETGLTPPAPTAYYFAVQPGTRIRDVIEGLQVSFSAQGLRVTDLGTTERIGRAVRLLLTGIVQGFMGLGLLAGIAALGLLGVQSVLERRQQLGTLRALGFTRRQVHATLVCEGTIIAGLGVALGLGLGLLLARSVVGLLAAAFPELRFLIPWHDIIWTMGIAWAGAALAIVTAAWQAGRVAPAEALRTV
jgi:putative ABC transport system permease protein